MSNKKRILIFIDWFTPAFKAGGPVQSIANLVESLKSEYELFILTSDRDLNDPVAFENIPLNIWLNKNGFAIMYLSQDQQNLKHYRNIFRDFKFDLVYINGLFSLPFALMPLFAARSHKTKIIIAPRGMLGAGALKLKYFKKKLFILFSSWFGIFKNVIWHATAETEFQEIRRHFGSKADIVLAPNLPSFRLVKNVIREKKTGQITLFFLSRISKKKNLLYAISLLKDLSPDLSIQFKIIGPIEDQQYWNECQVAISALPKQIHTEYLGSIHNNELDKYLPSYHLSILPTLHENFGHSIIESLQFGCPVIISNRTPWKNLQSPPSQITNHKSQITNHKSEIKNQKSEISSPVGWDLPLEEPGQFVKVIELCARMDQEEFNIISQNAFDFAKQIANDPAILEANRKLFE